MEPKVLFPTLLYKTVLDDQAWRDDLIKDIRKWRKLVPESIGRSNIGHGWHSPVDAMFREAFSPLVDCVLDTATEVFRRERYADTSRCRITEMWANENNEKSFHVPHHHGGALWACVYYAQVPEEMSHISFLDPRGPRIERASMSYGDNETHHEHVYPGMLLMFPADLMHYVEPHFKRGKRITVSTNIIQLIRKEYSTLPIRQADTPNYIIVPSVLSKEECAKFAALSDSEPDTFEPARVGKGKITEHRTTLVRFLHTSHRDSRYYWLGNKLREAAEEVNEKHFGLDISAGHENVQLGLYGAGDEYKEHTDASGGGFDERTLSCVIPIEEAETGGGLSFPSAESDPKTNIGDAIFFRADEPHIARQVKKGRRISMTAWFTQPEKGQDNASY